MVLSASILLKDIRAFCKSCPIEMKQLSFDTVSHRHCQRMLSPAEVIWVMILYQYSGYRCFKWFYEDQLRHLYRSIRWPGYSWFLHLRKTGFVPLPTLSDE